MADGGCRPLAQVLAEHSDRVAGYLRAIGADPAQTEEVVQEVAVAAAASADQPEAPLAWLLAVARRRFADLLRRNRKLRREQPIAELVAAVEAAMAEPDPGPDAEPVAGIDALRACLARLAPRARQAIELRYWRGLGPREIADEMGWSEAAVRVGLSKARQAIETCVRRALRGGEDGDGTR